MFAYFMVHTPYHFPETQSRVLLLSAVLVRSLKTKDVKKHIPDILLVSGVCRLIYPCILIN